jgi:hypothetical protein
MFVVCYTSLYLANQSFSLLLWYIYCHFLIRCFVRVLLVYEQGQSNIDRVEVLEAIIQPLFRWSVVEG